MVSLKATLIFLLLVGFGQAFADSDNLPVPKRKSKIAGYKKKKFYPKVKKTIPFGRLMLPPATVEFLNENHLFSEEDLSDFNLEQLSKLGVRPFPLMEIEAEMLRIRKRFKSSDLAEYLRTTIDMDEILKLNAAGVYTLKDLQKKSVRWIQLIFPTPKVATPREDKDQNPIASEKIIHFLRQISRRVYLDDLERAIFRGAMETPLDIDVMNIDPAVMEFLGPQVRTVGELISKLQELKKPIYFGTRPKILKPLTLRVDSYLLKCEKLLERRRLALRPPVTPNLED